MDALWFVTAWILGMLATLVVMLYRRLGRAEEGLSQANDRLTELQHEIERERLKKLIPVDGDSDPEADDPDDDKKHLWLVPPVSGAAAFLAGKIRHTFEVHTATTTTVTATMTGLAAASVLWGVGTVVKNDEPQGRPFAAPSAPGAPGGETIPPSAEPAPDPTGSQTPGGPSSTPSPTSPADTGPAGDPDPTEPDDANKPATDGNIASTAPGASGGISERPPGGSTSGSSAGGDAAGTGVDDPPPDGDTAGGADGGTDPGGTVTGGSEPPAEPDEEGLVCIGLTLPPLLDINRPCPL